MSRHTEFSLFRQHRLLFSLRLALVCDVLFDRWRVVGSKLIEQFLDIIHDNDHGPVILTNEPGFDLLSHATELGEYLRSRFRELAETMPAIVAVRGRGLFVGVEFVDENGTPDAELVKEIQTRCYENGVLIWSAGRYGNVLRLIPPLVLTQQQARLGTNVICDAIRMSVNGDTNRQ